MDDSITIDQGAEANVLEGGTLQLTATVVGELTVAWSSDDTDTATVDSETGEVTGVAEGSCTVTAADGDVDDTITINVLEAPTGVSGASRPSVSVSIGL